MRKTGRRHLLTNGIRYGIAIGIALLLLTGCDNLFGEEEEEEDGTLTVTISGFDPTTCGAETPYVIGFVMPAGADPNTGTVLGAGGGPVDSPTASDTIKVWDTQTDMATDVDWSGSGGDRYDVYAGVYCISAGEDPGDDLDNPKWVYGAVDYSQPFSYKQDGNQAFNTDFGDYAEIDPYVATP
ncbi:MAG: hypothetical protein PF508_22525 [Spirochaeta sp.]|jgi:hypothetical protein|nr:hypothetical protein [Spirochaeta sp.]